MQLITLFYIFNTMSLCLLADKRLEQIHTDFSHNKFRREDKSQYCIYCSMFGENLARGQKDINEAKEQWMKSESHKRILETKWKYTCIKQDTYNGKNYFVFIGAK